MKDSFRPDGPKDKKIRSAAVEPNSKTVRSARRRNYTIIAAIIALLGGIVAAGRDIAISLIEHPQPTQVAAVKVVPTSTFTVTPVAPGITEMPVASKTPISQPIDTPTTAPTSPQPAPAQPTPTSIYDFGSGCIATSQWTPSFSASYENGCYLLDKDGFLLLKGRGLNLSQDLPNEGLLAIYTPLKDGDQVRFDVSLTKLWGNQPKIRTYLLFGIGKKDNWFRQGQFLMFGSDPARQLGLFLTMLYPWNFNPEKTNLPFNDRYEVSFVLNGKNVQIKVGSDFQKILPLDADSLTKPVFMLGMAAPQGGSVDAMISNFEVISTH